MIRMILSVVVLCAAIASQGAGTTSPFAQPAANELRDAVRIMRADARFPRNGRFVSMQLAEPSKKLWYDSVRRATMPREIRSTVFDGVSGHTYEFTVDLRDRIVSEVRSIPSVQPMLTRSDYDSSEAIIRRFPRFRDAMMRYGIPVDSVAVETWASGIPVAASERVVRVLFYRRSADGINRYDRPIEGVSALVDLSKRVVKEWRERPTPLVPDASASYAIPNAKEQPLRTGSPVPGMVNDEVQWNGWRFRPVLHAREGLTLYDVRFVDQGRERRVAWRMALSEMLVPYGDTAHTWAWRNAFDVGEYGFGQMSMPLRRGNDVPESALLRPASFVEDDGTVITRPDVLAVYERDAGIAWRHAVSATAIASRHARELVVQHAATIANYDYIVSYVFAMDGTITVDVGLTGVMLVKGSEDTAYDATGSGAQMYAHLIARNVLAPSHQHFFNFRLDLDVDDTANVVTELDLRSPPSGPENRYGNAIMLDEWDIRSEREGARDASAAHGRTWRVSSRRRNALGIPSAYLIVPQSVAMPFLTKDALVLQRARFTQHQLFVTRHHPDELHAAGAYPNESGPDGGLPTYMANDDRLIRRDVVLWYTMGVNHLARPEDWPVMPMHRASFKIVPMGFFDRNPVLEAQSKRK
jgi:primary-amine oxidase